MHYRIYLKKIRKRSESVQIQSANDDLSDSSAIKMYIKSVSSMNKSTAREYYFRLVTFQKFIQNEYDISLDNLIRKFRIGSEDPYDVLSGYVVHLQNNFVISAATSKLRIITAKNFLEYNDVDISPRKFRFSFTWTSEVCLATTAGVGSKGAEELLITAITDARDQIEDELSTREEC